MKLGKRTRPATPSPSTRDPIASWLDVFDKLLGCSKSERDAIRAELEDHLRARVDDLMILGQSESEATRTAVGELGETADLAARFRQARTTPTRRRIMYASIFTMAGAALVLSAASFFGGSPGAKVPGQTPGAVEVGEVPSLIERRVEADIARGMKTHEALSMLVQPTGLAYHANWVVLEPFGIRFSDELPALPTKGLTVEHAVRLIGDTVGTSVDDPLMIQRVDTILEIAPRSTFDRRSITLREYDISALVSETRMLVGSHEGGVLFEAIQNLVEPNYWVDYGGDMASGQVFGQTMIISAPERMHDQIAYIVDLLEFKESERHAVERAEHEVWVKQLESKRARHQAEVERLLPRQGELIRQDIEHAASIKFDSPTKEEWIEREAAMKTLKQDRSRLDAELRAHEHEIQMIEIQLRRNPPEQAAMQHTGGR